MSYETVDSTSVHSGDDNQGLGLTEFLHEQINRNTDPKLWNPLLRDDFHLPEVKFFDSQSDSPGQKKADVPAQQQNNAPTEPAPPQTQNDDPKRQNTDAPVQPQNDGPATPQTDAPAKPPTDVPAKPQTGEPAKQQTDVPAKPPTDVPAKPQTGEPAKQQNDVPAKPQSDVPAQPQTQPQADVPAKSQTDVPAKPQTDVPTPSPTDAQPKGPTSETWGRFGRQYKIDTTGSAIYDVRKGDTYSAVARDVLEKRNGRVLDVHNAADRNEILKFSRELADHNRVKWGRNNFVLIRPGDLIRIPPAKKAEVAPASKPPASKPPEQKPPEQKPPEAKPTATNTEKPKEPSVMAGAISIQSQGGLYNLLQPPGFERLPGESWKKELDVKKGKDIENRTTVFSEVIPNEGKRFIYSGRVDTGAFSGTDFRAAELVDNQGRIIARKVEYAEPLKIRVNVPSSLNKELKVMAVESFFDRKSGTYTSRCLTKDGQVYTAKHSPDGTVMWGQ